MKKYAKVDDYISDQPAEVSKKLQQIRQIVKQAAPQATEKISYGIPYYGLNGRLVYFAAFKDHLSLFPASSSAIKEFSKDLASFQTSKGTIRFPLDKPLPLDLIRQIVEFRVQENLQKENLNI